MKTQEKQKNKEGKLMQENKMISKIKQNKRNNYTYSRVSLPKQKKTT